MQVAIGQPLEELDDDPLEDDEELPPLEELEDDPLEDDEELPEEELEEEPLEDDEEPEEEVQVFETQTCSSAQSGSLQQLPVKQDPLQHFFPGLH